MSEDRYLAGQLALVTGSTSGIGRAVAVELGRRGADVIVHGRDAVRGQAVVDAIVGEGGSARFIGADFNDPIAVGKLGEAVGDVDILVNNAGFDITVPTPDLDLAGFDRLFAVNVRAAYFLVAALAPKMVSRGSGNIVNLSSRAGEVGRPGGAAYSATKAALASLTRSWAAEFSPAGVRVNAVAPGPTDTAGAPALIKPFGAATTLLARAGQPHEVASVIAFLVSPAASFITGALYPVDGGRLAVGMPRPSPQ